MRHFKKLLYVSHATSDETAGLKQALSLARNNQASLEIAVVFPDFPKEFSSHKEKYESILRNDMEATVKATQEEIRLDDEVVKIAYGFISGKAPAISIIKHILQNDHDLVIKEAERREGQGGFKALDMDLLRKCPVPVWLCQPIEESRQDITVAVAIDPMSEEESAERLSLRMLELSRALADSCSSKLHVISCWDYVFESTLRDSVLLNISDAEVQNSVDRAEGEHREALEGLMAKSGIGGDIKTHHKKGKAYDVIPQWVAENGVDILVMGTVARTGIPGFMIGNTAENIVQQLNCSLMALKPSGYVSPVKA